MPVRDSEPVEPNGYTPWWEQHEGTNIRGLSRECAVGYLRMIFRGETLAKREHVRGKAETGEEHLRSEQPEEAPRPERARRRRQWGQVRPTALLVL